VPPFAANYRCPSCRFACCRLAGPGQKLDSAGRELAQALGEQPTAVHEVVNRFDRADEENV
jgi:hypothetical protein